MKNTVNVSSLDEYGSLWDRKRWRREPERLLGISVMGDSRQFSMHIYTPIYVSLYILGKDSLEQRQPVPSTCKTGNNMRDPGRIISWQWLWPCRIHLLDFIVLEGIYLHSQVAYKWKLFSFFFSIYLFFCSNCIAWNLQDNVKKWWEGTFLSCSRS